MKVAIVGGGHAGGTAAALLRQQGFTGDIALIADEPLPPYHRPPLSKAYLKGQVTDVELRIKPDAFYASQRINLLLGVRAEAIDAKRRLVRLEDGESVDYDVLILATGSKPRRLTLPGVNLTGVIQKFRNLEDARLLKSLLSKGTRLALIGGGYIGLELAAAARALGAEVTVVERESRVLARVASRPLSAFFDTMHRAHGVDIVTDAVIDGFEGNAEGQLRCVIAQSRRIPCDVALIGVGAVACDELARSAGLKCEQAGIAVNENALTSDACIYAIGDVSWRPMPHYEQRMVRLESVPNAMEQARRAVADILKKPQGAHEVPWFWSDQYEAKLQIAGMPFESDELIVRGSSSGGSMAVFHLKLRRLVAVEAVNSVAEFMVGRQLIARRAELSTERLADASYPMKALLE